MFLSEKIYKIFNNKEKIMGVLGFFLVLFGKNKYFVDCLEAARRERNIAKGELNRLSKKYAALQAEYSALEVLNNDLTSKLGDTALRLDRMTTSYKAVSAQLSSCFADIRDKQAAYSEMERKLRELKECDDIMATREKIIGLEETIFNLGKRVDEVTTVVTNLIYPLVSKYEGKKVAVVNVTEDHSIQDTLKVVIPGDIDFLEKLNGVKYDFLVVNDIVQYKSYDGVVVQCRRGSELTEIIRSMAQI